GKLRGWLFLGQDSVMTAQLETDGKLGDLPLSLRTLYADGRWLGDARATGEPAHWRSARLNWEPTQLIHASAHATGTLEEARLQLTVTTGSSTVALTSQVQYSPLSASGTLVTEHLSPRSLLRTAPIGDINLSSSFSASNVSKQIHLETE